MFTKCERARARSPGCVLDRWYWAAVLFGIRLFLRRSNQSSPTWLFLTLVFQCRVRSCLLLRCGLDIILPGGSHPFPGRRRYVTGESYPSIWEPFPWEPQVDTAYPRIVLLRLSLEISVFAVRCRFCYLTFSRQAYDEVATLGA